jgi:polysaccharide export outer membrane protein
MRSAISILCMLSLAHAVVGCSANFKPPPTYPKEDPAYASPNKPMAGLDADPPVPFVLLNGDTITVRTISAESQEYGGLIIDNEGKVHVPIVGTVQVANLAPHQAERAIEAAVQKYDRFVRVSVLVSDWGGHTASVIGAVVAEGSKQVKPGLRLAQLVADAGGLLRNTEGTINYVADIDGARLIREGKEMPVSLTLALLGDARHNILIRAGDELFIPPGLGNRIAVIGEDPRGMMVLFRPGMRLTETIAATGGLPFATDERDIRIIRGSLKNPLMYQYSMKDFAAGKTGDVELAPGDVVYVSRHWSATMTEVINKITPLIGLALTAFNTYLLLQNFEATKQIKIQTERAATGN